MSDNNKLLSWSQEKEVYNGKIKPCQDTLFVVAYHVGEGWFVHPKLPGLKSIKVESLAEGMQRSEEVCRNWFWRLKGPINKMDMKHF